MERKTKYQSQIDYQRRLRTEQPQKYASMQIKTMLKKLKKSGMHENDIQILVYNLLKEIS
jgi:chemotaxis receptor (MCP) glutamine deamidase CheD